MNSLHDTVIDYICVKRKVVYQKIGPLMNSIRNNVINYI